MSDTETMPHAHFPSDRNAQIAYLNDQLRCHARGGQVAITYGVLDLPDGAAVMAIVKAGAYDDFNAENDPYGERDFGAFTLAGETLFWKIDYYDRDMRFASPDPVDPDVTIRLMTIMLASEY